MNKCALQMQLVLHRKICVQLSLLQLAVRQEEEIEKNMSDKYNTYLTFHH